MTKPHTWRGCDTNEYCDEVGCFCNQHSAQSPPPKNFPDTPAVVSSRAVSWWPVHEYVQPVLDRVGDFPMVGTPEWCALPDDHPKRIAAMFAAAAHWALRLEMAQEAQAEASKAISVAAGYDDDGDPITWAEVARHVRDQEDFYAEHPWAKRRPA